MSQERETPRVCEHGQLARSCEICELKRELAESKAEAKRERERRRQIDDEAFEYAEKLQKAEAERDAAHAAQREAENEFSKAMAHRAISEARCRELELEVKTLNEDFDAVEAEHAEHIAQAKFELSRLEADARRYQHILSLVSGDRHPSGKPRFKLPEIEAHEGIFKGSVAEHFSAAIDAAIVRDGGEDGR